jgi:hypothetical protein
VSGGGEGVPAESPTKNAVRFFAGPDVAGMTAEKHGMTGGKIKNLAGERLDLIYQYKVYLYY